MDFYRNEVNVYIDPLEEVKSYIDRLKDNGFFPLPSRLIYTPIISNRLEKRARKYLKHELPSLYPLTTFYLLNGDVLFFRGLMGAPTTSIFLEELIAIGINEIVFLGLAGAIQEAKIGDILVVTEAERFEGTSYHYFPPATACIPSEELNIDLISFLSEKNLHYKCGKICTIDAPYRETLGLIDYLRLKGVFAIEMEISAVFSVSNYRNVRSSALLIISDELKDENWSNFRPDLYYENFLSSLDYLIEFLSKK